MIYTKYRRKGETWARPYIEGETLKGVSVNKEDTPKRGGLVAINPENPEDKWYVSPEYAEEFLESTPQCKSFE